MCQGMNNNWQMMYPEQDLSLIVVVQFKLQMGEDTKALNLFTCIKQHKKIQAGGAISSRWLLINPKVSKLQGM